MTLHDRIQQLVNLGYKDPLTIARTIVEGDDREWLQSELLGLAEDIVAELARQEVGRDRRAKVVAIRPGAPLTGAQAKTATVWIPGSGYTKVADVTIEDASRAAEWYRKAGVALFRRSAWFSELVGMMRAEGARTIGELRAELPALPDEDELALPPAAQAEGI
jgi:hypothetical protein